MRIFFTNYFQLVSNSRCLFENGKQVNQPEHTRNSKLHQYGFIKEAVGFYMSGPWWELCL